MLDLLITYTIGCVGFAFIGYMSPKFFLYGLVATATLWFCYTLLPGLAGSTVLNMMIPKLLAIWTLYPRLLAEAPAMGAAEHGLAGTIIYTIVALGLFLPYGVGIIAGVLTWPELIILRMVF